MNLLKQVWRVIFAAWMKFAHVLGIINTTILLTLVYLIVILPMKSFLVIFRKDPLRLRSFHSGPAWHSRIPERSSMDERSHPF